MHFANVELLVWMLCLHQGLGVIREPSHHKLPPKEFVHRVVLDQMDAYVLLWTPEKNDITFEIQVRTRGYAGLGFSPNGAMKGADIVIGWVDDSGVVHFSDRHGTGNKTPIEDKIQDYTLLGGYKNESHTVLRFSRPWVTCDKDDDMSLSEETVRVLWAYDEKLPDPKRSILNYHDHRGSKSLYLKEPKMQDVPQDVEVWDIRSSYVIPDELDTVYWCKLYKAPDLPRKYHMIGYEPIIGVVSEGLVHHMLFYECSLKESEKHLEKWVSERGTQCYSLNMPISWGACGSPLIAWAFGSKGETLPEHVGFPIGEDHGGATYFLLEIHYDNPQHKKGIVDSSGLRIYLSDKLRPYDVGVLTVGHVVVPTMIIPPGKIWDILGHCTKECTRKGINSDGINIFSSLIHSHLIGSAVEVQHIRDGKELRHIARDRSYDFNYQQSRSVSPEKRVLPGDHLITTCTYDATRRVSPTFGGLGTKEEMCLAFLHYYPRVALGECISRIDMALVFDAFGIKDINNRDHIMRLFSQEFNYNSFAEASDDFTFKAIKKPAEPAMLFVMSDFFRTIKITQPISMRGKTFYDILMDESVWRDPEVLKRLKDAATKLQFEPNCFYRNRTVISGIPKKSRYPRYNSYWESDDVCTNGIPSHLLEKSAIEPPMDISALDEGKGSGVGKLQEPNELQSARRGQGGNGTAQNKVSWISIILAIFLSFSFLSKNRLLVGIK